MFKRWEARQKVFKNGYLDIITFKYFSITDFLPMIRLAYVDFCQFQNDEKERVLHSSLSDILF